MSRLDERLNYATPTAIAAEEQRIQKEISVAKQKIEGLKGGITSREQTLARLQAKRLLSAAGQADRVVAS